MMANTHHPIDQIRLRWLLATIATLLVCASPATAQLVAEPSTDAAPWTYQNQPDDPNEFHFAIVSDNAANPREGVFETAVAKLQLLRPKLVLCVGDLIHGYGQDGKPLTDEDAVRKRRERFDEIVRPLSMPFYRVAGNHDINNDLSAGIWKERYGPAYYSFACKNVLFLCMNSQDGRNYGAGIGGEQIAWAKGVLAEHNDASWVCLFFHQPLWLEDEKRLQGAKAEDGLTQLTGFHEIEKLLKGRDYTVFAGHHHRYGKWIKNGNKYFRLATTGGQSALGGPESGQFDHVMWVTMTGKGPIFCNLLLEGILDEDAKTNMPGTSAAGKQ